MQTIEPRALADGATLRAATSDDAERIHELIRELALFEKSPQSVVTTPQIIADALSDGTGTVNCHVIEDHGRVVAIALWYRNFSTWTGFGAWLDDLYVQEAYRGRGYGAALLGSIAAICVREGWRRMEWWALKWNTPAIGFYESIGAEPQDEWTVFRLDGEALHTYGTINTNPSLNVDTQ